MSFDEFAPNFVQRFVESHVVMLTGNAGLKPKEGEYTSRPWEWPINLRGQYFSGKDHRVYLLGNPIIWWGNIAFLLLFGLTYLWNMVREQRGHVDADPAIRSAFALSSMKCKTFFSEVVRTLSICFSTGRGRRGRCTAGRGW